MAAAAGNEIASLVSRNEQAILPEWIELQKKAGTLNTGRISEGELQSQSQQIPASAARRPGQGRQQRLRSGV